MGRGSVQTKQNKDGSTTYYAVIVTGIKPDGKPNQEWKGFKKESEAEAYLDRVSTDVREGTYRQIKPASVNDLCDKYEKIYFDPKHLKNRKHYKPSVIQSDASVIARIRRIAGKWQAANLEMDHIEEIEGKLRQQINPHTDRPYADNTVRNTMNVLHKILKFGIKQKHLKLDPMAGYELSSNTDHFNDDNRDDEDGQGRALSLVEITKLLAQCATKLALVVMIALYAGLRRAEIFALYWAPDSTDLKARSYVDFERNKIYVNKAVYFLYGKSLEKYREAMGKDAPAYRFMKPKKNSVRVVPLNPVLKRLLLDYKLTAKDKSGLIFQTENGTAVDPNNLCRYQKHEELFDASKGSKPRAHFSDALWQAGIVARFHDLRHSYGSILLNQLGKSDFTIFQVSKWMGHSSIDITCDIYGHKMGTTPEQDQEIFAAPIVERQSRLGL